MITDLLHDFFPLVKSKLLTNSFMIIDSSLWVPNLGCNGAKSEIAQTLKLKDKGAADVWVIIIRLLLLIITIIILV